MSRRTAIVFTAAVIVTAVIAIYAAVDPVQAQWMPKCPVYTLTGWKCPGCGSQRMLHALLTGNIGEAFSCNPLLLCMMPVIAVLLFAEIWRRSRPRLYARLYSPATIAVILTAIILWTIVRNILGL